MTTCQELIEFLSDYLDGQLPTTQRMTFELHLSLCPDCRAYLYNFKTTIQLTQRACSNRPDDDPADIPENLVKAILNSRREG